MVVTDPATHVKDDQEVRVDDVALALPEAPRLWRYYKPRGLITTHHDPQGRPTIFEALPETLPRVVSVGRLDIESEGLLLLTNQGPLAEMLAHPRYQWKRQYRVRVRGDVTQVALDSWRGGVRLAKSGNNPAVQCAPVEARLERKGQGKNHWVHMVLHEGKNREIRRLCAQMGWQVSRLIRVGYGPFTLEDLRPGELCEIDGSALGSLTKDGYNIA